MKKLFYLFNTLLLTAALAACSSDYDDPPEQPDSHQQEEPATSKTKEGVYSPVKASEELTSFMSKALPNGSRENYFFESRNSSCIIIHSYDEFSEKYHGSEKLPEIDFERYSLVVGQEDVEQFGYYLVKHEIVSAKDGLTLNLTIRLSGGFHEQSFTSFYYWGLYPKLNESTISVKVTKHYNY